jgi:hypothetical protein
VYESVEGRLKYTFHVAPGADPGLVRLAYRGATRVGLTDRGRLSVETPVGGFEDDTPYVYQEDADGNRTTVASAYAPEDAAGGGAYAFGFRLGDYDRSRTLFLDPTVLVYCGYIGARATTRARTSRWTRPGTCTWSAPRRRPSPPSP